MNDLRSANRASPTDRSGPKTGEVVSGQSQISQRSPSARPQSRRQASAPDRRVASTGEYDDDDDVEGGEYGTESYDVDLDDDFDDDGEADGPLSFRVSRDLRSMTTSASGHSSRNGGRPASTDGSPVNGAQINGKGADHLNGTARSGTGPRSEPDDSASGPPTRRGRSAAGPASRPAKRRDESAIEDDEELDDEDRFPWHHQFKNDEPEELQAKSRLLSRAFRSSVG